MSSIRYDITSPDGFSIHPTDIYESQMDAEKAFTEWKKRFSKQGHYASVNGNIPLDKLREHCLLVEVPQVAIAVIDMSTLTLHIHNTPERWDSEETEEFLRESGYHLSNCSWGEFDGEIHDER